MHEYLEASKTQARYAAEPYTYIVIYIYMYVCVCIHMFIDIYVYIYIHVCLFVSLLICLSMFLFVLMYPFTHNRVITARHKYTHQAITIKKNCSYQPYDLESEVAET